jgi:Ca-activated chloride channel family protein
VRYIYPLNTEKFSSQPLEQVSVRVEINDRQSIRAIYSPSHNLDINRADQNNVIATYEASQVLPDKDFSLFYSVGETNAFHLMSYRDSADPQDSDGFFLLLLAPPPLTSDQQVAKDILLVLDRSGSMEGEKFSQAQSALKFILNHLNPEDRFYLMAFSSDLQTYSNSLSPANKADDAIGWVNQLGSAGSTDINRALLETAAVVDDKRPTYLIFLTDGLPTEGVTDSQEILKNFSLSAPNNLRLFPFGVGYDVDTILLDTLSSEQHGLSTYVQPGQNLDEALSAFYARISTPVLTNLSLDFGSLAVYDVYPNPLPDLFAGSQVIVVGRYRKGGMTDVMLKGDVNGSLKNQEYPQQYFDVDSRASNSILSEIPRLWATRKIGYLLNKIRLQGADQETIDQIVRLSIRYGIITPYTSYLVTEPMPLGVENQERLSQQTYQDYQAQPTMASGEGAVNKAAEQGAMSQAEVAPPSSELSQQKVKTVGSRTFVLSDGSWIDTAFDSTTMQTQKIAFLSTEYFTLAQSRADVSAALALGEQVILLVDGNAYEIVAEGSVTDNVPLPPTETPSALETPDTQTTNTPAPTSRPTSNTTSQTLPSTDQPGCAAGILPLFGILAFFSVKGLKKHNPR